MRTRGVWAAAIVAAAAIGCGGDEATPSATGATQQTGAGGAGQGGQGGQGGAGTAGGGQGGHGGQGGAPPSLGVDDAPAAKVVASLALAAPVAASVAADPYLFLLRADKDCDVLEVSDAKHPRPLGVVTTAGRVVAVAYDDAHHLAYVADDAGVVQAVDLTALGPTPVGSLAVPTLKGSIGGIARVGDRLFVVAGKTLQPLAVARSAGEVSIALEAPIALPEEATSVAAGAGAIYLAGAGGLTAWSAPPEGEAPKKLGSIDVGGAVVGLVARGSKVLAVAKDKGLGVVDFAQATKPALVYSTDELADATGVTLLGRTLVVPLARGAFTALDVSTFDRPRAVTTTKGPLPKWIALSHGHLVYGTDQQGSVAVVPPFLAGRLAGPTLAALPRGGVVPVTLSKEIDPATVSAKTTKLTCAGAAVEGTAAVSPDRRTILFSPTAPLPATASCVLDVGGVRDAEGQAPSAGADGATMTFTTDAPEPAPVVNEGSAYPHVIDGGFTDWKADGGPGQKTEWSDVTPAKGMYTYFYANFDGQNLSLLNDWVFNGENIEPDCYNRFNVWTGNGAEQWEVRAYGDQHVEVRKNGTLVDPESEGVKGGASYGPSPNQAAPHTQYEIGIKASPGNWGVQLHDPGPTFACGTLAQEPSNMTGTLGAGGGNPSQSTLDVGRFVAPAAPQPIVPLDGEAVALPVSLRWTGGGGGAGGGGSAYYEVQLGTDPALSPATRLFDDFTYDGTIAVPSSLLKEGAEYYWHVIAWNPAGSATGPTFRFQVEGEPQNQNPVAADDAATTVADEAVVIDVLANDSDPDLDPFTVVDVGAPVNGSAQIEQHTIVYTPKKGFTGKDSFTYAIGDGKGGSASATVTVTVTPAQQAGVVTFAPAASFPTAQGASAVTTVDLNADGKPDVVTAQGTTVSVLMNTTVKGSFVAAFAAKVDVTSGADSRDVVAGDFDGDGKADLAVVNGKPGTVTVLLNKTAAGAPTPVFAAGVAVPLSIAPAAALAIAAGDIDGDGKIDLAVSHTGGRVDVLSNITQAGGPLTFVEPWEGGGIYFGVGVLPGEVALGDLDGDKKLDVVVADQAHEVVLVLPAAGPLATLPCTQTPWSVALGDFDGDKRLDVAVSSKSTLSTSVLTNATQLGGALAFQQAADFNAGATGTSTLVGDLNVDGRMDLVVGAAGGDRVAVLVNSSPPGSVVPSFDVVKPIAMNVDAALCDVNGDGLPDVVTTLGASVTVLLNATFAQ